MRFGLTYCSAALIAATPALSQEMSAQCQGIFDEIVADIPTDYQSCDVTARTYELETCEPPQTFNARQPTSHLILAIDASGSMAGSVGGESKMQIAQREALRFLQDVPDEVEVGLVVYGHRGTNQESGRVESCATSELIHDFDTNRTSLEATIGALSPTGWTPLGGALAFSGDIIATLDPPAEGDLAPVIYMISDGEETCDGDPVAAATALYEAGVQTTVNTIGFDVNAETAAQLEAIANAGGGTYYPARDGQALRAQLEAIRESEHSLAQYRVCTVVNTARITNAYLLPSQELAGCFQRNNPMWAQSAVLNAMNTAERENLPEAICAAELRNHVLFELDMGRDWLEQRVDPLINDANRLVEEYNAFEQRSLLGEN